MFKVGGRKGTPCSGIGHLECQGNTWNTRATPGTTKKLLLPIQNRTLAIEKLCVSLDDLSTIPNSFTGS